jgi:tRNA(adenine34) deaminase
MLGEKIRIRDIWSAPAGIMAAALLLMLFLAAASQAEKLEKTAGNDTTLDEIQASVDSFLPVKLADRFALVALQEALDAAREGNYGYGAVLVNESTGEIVERGHNHVFYPYFCSDLHAEMDVLNKYEERMKASGPRISGLVLYCTGESGPMGLGRIINSGIPKMYYLAGSQDSGMVHMMDCLPPIWQEMAKGRDYRQADCSPELVNLSEKIINYSEEELDRRLKK